MASSSEADVAEVKRLGEALSRWARGALAAGDRDAACARLAELAGHEDRKVRYAVVFAAAHAPDACFDAVVPRLARDPNVSVARAASGALVERTAKRKAVAALDGQAEDIASLEQKLEAQHGKAALRLARALAGAREEQLARNLRHEFKKNVGAFKLAIGNLEAEARCPAPDPARLREHAEDARLTGDLQLAVVDVSCDAGDGAKVRYAKESVRVLVEHAVSLLQKRATAPERLKVTVEIGERLAVDADRGRVLMAFSNVLENAVEAYAEGAASMPIHVAAREEKEGSCVTVSFRDEGCGIRREELPHVFAPFATSKPGVRGFGLGHVKKMIETAHGGSVRIESERGRGTTVFLTLPKEQGGG